MTAMNMDIKQEKPDIKSGSKQNDDGFVVRIRGLPWSASKDDIIKFFDCSTIKNGPRGIHLTMSREGRPSGEAYIEFEGQEDLDKALAKDNEHLGSRYIEVFKSDKSEMEWALHRCGLDGEEAFGDACVRLRGLPFGCSKEEIAQFFTGLEIVRNGITLPTDYQGRSTGEAYVQFASQDIAEKAMGKHKEKIGHRYIEIFKSSLQEIRSAVGMGPVRMRSMGSSNRMTPYDRMDRPGGPGGYSRSRNFGGFDDGYRDFGMLEYPTPGAGRRGGAPPVGGFGSGDRLGFFGRGRDLSTGHRVHMRGLPYRAVERDIYEFFAPLKPVQVSIKYEPSGRSSGEADVEFPTHEEALKAMKRDKEKIQHRYIELFLHSEPEPFRRGPPGDFNDMGPLPDERPFGGPGMERPFGRSGTGRPYLPENERPFAAADRNFGGPVAGERGFGGPAAGERGFGGPSASDRGFGGPGVTDRGFGSPAAAERGFGSASSSDRGFGFSGADRSFGSPAAGERSFGGASNRSFGPSDRSYASSADRFGASGERPMGMAAERSYGMADRPYNDRSMGISAGEMDRGGFRNGMAGSGSSGNVGSFRNDYGGRDTQRGDDSEFYGSGKMFGEAGFQQPMSSMIGGSNYSSF